MFIEVFMKKLAICLIFLTAPICAATISWLGDGSGGGTWTNPAHWVGGVLPTINDLTTFPAGGVFNIINATGDGFAQKLTFNPIPANSFATHSLTFLNPDVLNLGADGIIANAQPDGNPYTVVMEGISLQAADTTFEGTATTDLFLKIISETIIPSNVLIRGIVTFLGREVNNTGDTEIAAGATLTMLRNALNQGDISVLSTIIGAGNLVINNPGFNVTLTKIPTYTGTTTLTDGTFILAPTVPANISLAGVISGSGDLVNNNPGFTTTLAAIPTFTGTATLTAGTLSLAPATPADFTFANVTSGAGGLGNNNPGFTTSLTTNPTFTGTAILTAGTLSLAPTTPADFTFANATSGAGGLGINNSGFTTTLTTVPTYTGATVLTAGTLDLAPTVPANFSMGAVNGAGNLINNNSGFTTTLTGIPSYSGTTTLTAGTLSLAPTTPADISLTGVISGSGDLVNNNSGFTTSLGGIPTFTGTATLTAGTLSLAPTTPADFTFSIVTSGAGGLGINNPGFTTTLPTIPTYTGATILTAGTLALALTTPANVSFASAISGAGNLINNNSGFTTTLTGIPSYSGTTSLTAGTLALAPATPADFTFPSAISGAGNLINNNSGFTTTLSGIPTFTGTTTLTAGTLALAPATPADFTFANAISGGGSLSFSNSGFTTTLSGTTLNYTGATTLIRGTLNLPSGKTISASDVVVNSGANPITDAILTGEGTITGSLTVTKGTVLPGSSSTTQLNVGPYTQTADGKLKIVITPDSASKLVVTGDAVLDGDLELEIGTGSYPDETTFEVLNTSGVLNGTTFATLTETHIGPWEIGYQGDNTVSVLLPLSVVVTPVPLSSLKGNERTMGDYMYADPNFVTSNADLNNVSTAMLALSPGDFETALLEVSSLPLTALPVVDLQNNIQMAIILDKQYKKTVNNSLSDSSQNESEAPCFAIPHTGLFIEPIGLYYNQRQADGSLSDTGQIPFESFTYGAGLGWEQVLGDHFIIEGGVGYTYSTLNWKDDFGNANWNSIYLAPFFGWFNARAFANLMVLGAVNFHDTKRNISFPGLHRVAKSRYHSYDLLVRVNGGYRLPLKKNFWFQPEGTVNYLTVFTDAYTEKDAGSINLQVKDKTTYILQPSFRARFTKEFLTKRFCYAPTLYAGWLANVPLNGDNVAARFVDAPTQTFFNMQGYDQTTNQLILGAEFYMKRFEKFELTSDFEVDMLSQFEVYVFKVKFQWMF